MYMEYTYYHRHEYGIVIFEVELEIGICIVYLTTSLQELANRQTTYMTITVYSSDLVSMKTEVKSEGTCKDDPDGDTSKKSPLMTSMDKTSDGAGDANVKVKKEPGSGSITASTPVKGEEKEAKEGGKKSEKPRLGISEAVRKELERIVAENRRIQDLATTVHQKNHEITLRVHIFDTRGRDKHCGTIYNGCRLFVDSIYLKFINRPNLLPSSTKRQAGYNTHMYMASVRWVFKDIFDGYHG